MSFLLGVVFVRRCSRHLPQPVRGCCKSTLDAPPMGESSANASTSKMRDIDSASTVDLRDRVPRLDSVAGTTGRLLCLGFRFRSTGGNMEHSTGPARSPTGAIRALVPWLARVPGLEDRPSNFGSPQRVVSGFGGADEVVLANRPVDRKRMLGHVSGEDAISTVDVGVGTGVDNRRQLRRWDYGRADASDRLGHRIARKEDRGSSPVLGE
jgi:hypothetical protein